MSDVSDDVRDYSVYRLAADLSHGICATLSDARGTVMTDYAACDCCGEFHPIDEHELLFRLPDEIFKLSDEDRDTRCRLIEEMAILDETRFFIRGVLPLPVRQRTRAYHLGLWAEVSKEDFTRIFELWGDPAQATEPALSGSLATAVPLHPETIGLRVAIQLVGANLRPVLFLMPLEHSLFHEQSRGIHVHRAFEYADRESRAADSEFRRAIPVPVSNTGRTR